MRILLIEDDELARQSLVDQLLAEGVETVYQASDFAGALDFIRNADGIVCDDAFPIVAGERPFELSWMAMRDAARALTKPFVLTTDDREMWLEALHQDVNAYRKQDATEAVVHMCRALRKSTLATPVAAVAGADVNLDAGGDSAALLVG